MTARMLEGAGGASAGMHAGTTTAQLGLGIQGGMDGVEMPLDETAGYRLPVSGQPVCRLPRHDVRRLTHPPQHSTAMLLAAPGSLLHIRPGHCTVLCILLRYTLVVLEAKRRLMPHTCLTSVPSIFETQQPSKPIHFEHPIPPLSSPLGLPLSLMIQTVHCSGAELHRVSEPRVPGRETQH